jgi:hypothetical protein
VKTSAPDETAVLAEFGRENIETLAEVYAAFVDRVDTRALLTWRLPDGLDDLLLPLFTAALVAITKDLRLGEFACIKATASDEAKEP